MQCSVAVLHIIRLGTFVQQLLLLLFESCLHPTGTVHAVHSCLCVFFCPFCKTVSHVSAAQGNFAGMLLSCIAHAKTAGPSAKLTLCSSSTGPASHTQHNTS